MENSIKNVFNRLSVKNLARIGVRVICLSMVGTHQVDGDGREWAVH